MPTDMSLPSFGSATSRGYQLKLPVRPSSGFRMTPQHATSWSLCSGRKIAVLALCLVTMAHTCGTAYNVVRRYHLPASPDTTFVLPVTAEDAGYELSSQIPHQYQVPTPCVEFRVYRLSLGGELGYFSLRLNRERQFSVDVAYGYINAGTVGPLGGRKPDDQKEQRAAYWADIAARVAMKGSGMAPDLPPDTVVRLQGSKEIERWCSRGYRSDSSAP